MRRAFFEARRALTEKKKIEKQARRKSGKSALLLVGAGAVTAAGLALAITRERANTAPTAEMLVTPGGTAIFGVSIINFAARGTDAENDPISYRWSFGDGATAVGASVSHIFQASGDLQVVLTVSDGLMETTTRRFVSVMNLNGTWRVAGETFVGYTEVDIRQRDMPDANVVSFLPRHPNVSSAGGVITNPRHLGAAFHYTSIPVAQATGWNNTPPCNFQVDGDLTPDLRTISATVYCVEIYMTCHCGGQQQAITLSR